MSCARTNVSVQDLGQSTDMPTPSVDSGGSEPSTTEPSTAEPSTIGESSPIRIMPCARTNVFVQDHGQQSSSPASPAPILTETTTETGLYRRDSPWKAQGYLPGFGLSLKAPCEDSGESRSIRTSILATRNQPSNIVLRSPRSTRPGRNIRH